MVGENTHLRAAPGVRTMTPPASRRSRVSTAKQSSRTGSMKGVTSLACAYCSVAATCGSQDKHLWSDIGSPLRSELGSNSTGEPLGVPTKAAVCRGGPITSSGVQRR